MAISLSYFPILSALLLAFSVTIEAATVTYDWNVTWVQANPDGLFSRPTIGINGAWPLPILRANVGDNVVINLENQLGNQSTSLHFHGLYMNGSNHMDGPAQATQCPVNSGLRFQYNFTITQPGTYWYHSHSMGQYPDGLRAPLIITDPNMPYKGDYDEEVILSLSDWYHDEMQTLLPKFISKANPTGAEPVPDSALMNDTQNVTISLVPGKTYLFRVVNMGAFAGQHLWFEGHNMTIVEVDGIYTQKTEAEMLYLTAAQRCSFLITAKNDTTANYAFSAAMDTDLFDTVPPGLNTNVTGWLVYDSKNDNNASQTVDAYNDFDDFTLVPYDNQTLYQNPSKSVELSVIMANLGDGANYAFFNNITYTPPQVPTLYTVMSAGTQATDPVIYGDYTHSFVLGYKEVIEIVVNNMDVGKHPFHLHGHNFQAIVRSDENTQPYTNNDTFPDIPMRRDTIMVRPGGYIVLRFVSDNPGVWLFHCHIEWHVSSGLTATMIEAPLELQKNLVIPSDHLAACAAAGIPTVGNAASNSKDYTVLTGQNTPPAPLPDGFTARGIVALTFTVFCALLGLAVIVWYGLADMGTYQMEQERVRLAQAHIETSSLQ